MLASSANRAPAELCPKLVEAVAERNLHVREMLALARLAEKFDVPSSAPARLETWVRDWLARNPRQAALLVQRFAS